MLVALIALACSREYRNVTGTGTRGADASPSSDGSDGSTDGSIGAETGGAGAGTGGASGTGNGGTVASGGNGATGGTTAGGAGGTAADGGTSGGATGGSTGTGGSTATGGAPGTGGTDGGPKAALTVTAVDRYVTDTDIVNQAVDFSQFDVAVLVYNTTARSFSSHAPTIDGAGQFSVDVLPAGDRYVRYAPLGQAPRYYVTTSSTLDLGVPKPGRADVRAPSAGTKLSFTLTNLAKWQDGNIFEFVSLGANTVAFNAQTALSGAPAVGATSLSSMVDDYTAFDQPFLIDGSAGDKAYLTELDLKPLGASDSYLALDRVYSAPSFSLTDGSTTPLSGAFTTPTTTSLDVDWKKSQFDDAALTANPSATIFARVFGVAAQPHSEFGQFSGSPDLVQYVASDGSDLATTFTFANPFAPAWPSFIGAIAQFSRSYTAQGAAAGVFHGVVSTSIVPGTGSTTVAPLVSCPTDVLIAGKDATADQTGVGTTPRVTFGAPATGTPNGYEVDFYRLGSNGTKTTFTFVGSVTTVSRSVVVPPGILATGSQYMFSVAANLRGSIDMNTQPLPFAFPGGFAQTLSGIVQP
jgi:hypothetical protein